MRNHLRLVGPDEPPAPGEEHRLRSWDSRTDGRGRCLCGAHSEWGVFTKVDRQRWWAEHMLAVYAGQRPF